MRRRAGAALAAVVVWLTADVLVATGRDYAATDDGDGGRFPGMTPR